MDGDHLRIGLEPLMYLWLQLEVEVSFNGPVEFTDTRILCPEDAHQTKKLHQLSIMTGYHAFILLTRSVCNGAAAEAVVAREATDLTVFPSIPLGSGYLTIPVLATFPRSTSIPLQIQSASPIQAGDPFQCHQAQQRISPSGWEGQCCRRHLCTFFL